MIQADCQPGVVTGMLDSSVQNLRRLLTEYRSELTRSEAAFAQWESRWNAREREIDAHLQTIESRLGTSGPTTGPALMLVRGDE